LENVDVDDFWSDSLLLAAMIGGFVEKALVNDWSFGSYF